MLNSYFILAFINEGASNMPSINKPTFALMADFQITELEI